MFIGVSLITTIFVMMIHTNGRHDNHSRVPDWVRKWLLHRMAIMVGMRRYVTDDQEHETKVIQINRLIMDVWLVLRKVLLACWSESVIL